jgi:hypothetical protein
LAERLSPLVGVAELPDDGKVERSIGRRRIPVAIFTVLASLTNRVATVARWL